MLLLNLYKYRLFADDCILFNNIHSLDDQTALNSSLNSILSWCTQWGMRINYEKSVYLRITNKTHPLKFSYMISNNPLAEVNKYKYLGVTITNKLS